MVFRPTRNLVPALAVVSLAAQTTPNTATHASASPSRSVAAALKPYTGCDIAGGPDLVKTFPLPQAPMTRPAQTLTGTKQIKIVDGLFAAFAYNGGAPFANVKIELLPAATYTTEKAELISEFDAINAKGEDTQRNYAMKPKLNGFEIYGFDRTALDGNVLGIYLFFDDPHHVATTAYFLNAAPAQRHFATPAEYSGLREGFLDAYTGCVRKALGGAASAPPSSAKKKATAAHHSRRKK